MNQRFWSFTRFTMLIAGVSATIFLSIHESSAVSAGVEPASLGRLAFQRTNYFTSGQITSSLHSVKADGTAENTLAPANVPPVLVREPAYSPDGTKVVYNSDSDIWVMNADGSGKLNLTNNHTMFVEGNPSWSAGGRIAYERAGQIWTMNPDGSAQATFVDWAFVTAPAWSPDGQKLAYLIDGRVWIYDTVSGVHRNITFDFLGADPSWAPDGTRVIYARGDTGITVVDVASGSPHHLTFNPLDGKPAWSNDGTKIAFVRRGTTVNGIYTMDAVGGNVLRLIADVPNQPGRNEHDNPVWQPVAQIPNTSIISGRIARNGESQPGVIINISGSANRTTSTNALGEYRFEALPHAGSYTITPSDPNHIFTPRRRIFSNLAGNRIADFNGGENCATPGCRVNGRVIFVRGNEIFTSAADGTAQLNVSNTGSAIEEHPAFSPDGTKIIFQSNRDGNYEIYQANADGSNPQRLTNNAASDNYPSYSPDGSRIVFSSARDGNDEIYTMNSDGSNQQRLTDTPMLEVEPAFSADGTKIAYSRTITGTSGTRAIFSMNAGNGSGQTQISTPPAPNFFDLTPSYSPDGTKIVFARFDSGAFGVQLVTANADGMNPTNIPVSGIAVRKPSFSPDGTKIVFARQVGVGITDVMAYTLAGGAIQTLVQNGHHPDWQPIRPAVRPTASDFDGDGRADISVFRPSERIWYLLRTQAGFTAAQWGLPTDKIVPADYDGDTKTDIAVWRESDGNFYILNSANGTIRIENFGLGGDSPLPADFDGDGKADVAVYRPAAQGTFYYRGSFANPGRAITFIPWGSSGDKPVVGDYDGDALADAAVFRPSNGVWYVRQSSDGQLAAAAFGLSIDKPVPADYDSDGKTDLAVYRNGTWFLLRSSAGFTQFNFGIASDVPVAADYDGDGSADAAVYRDGAWYRYQSSAGIDVIGFGLAGDKPVPAAYIH